MNYLTNQLEGYIQINSQPPTPPIIEEGAGSVEGNQEEEGNNQNGGKMEILGPDGQWQTIKKLEELIFRQIFKDILRGELREVQNYENGYQLQLPLPSIYEKPYIIGDNKEQIPLPPGKLATELFNNEFNLEDTLYRPLYLIEGTTRFPTTNILHRNIVKILAHIAYRFYINMHKNMRTNINENTHTELSMLESYKQSAERCTELVKCVVVYSACEPSAKLLLFQKELLFRIKKLLPLINKYNNREPFKNALQEEIQFKYLITFFKLYFKNNTTNLNNTILNEDVNPGAIIIKKALSKIKTFLDNNPIITNEPIDDEGPVNNAPLGLPEGASGLPEDAAGLPEDAAGLPEGASGLPEGAFGLPEGAGTGILPATTAAAAALGKPNERVSYGPMPRGPLQTAEIVYYASLLGVPIPILTSFLQQNPTIINPLEHRAEIDEYFRVESSKPAPQQQQPQAQPFYRPITKDIETRLSNEIESFLRSTTFGIDNGKVIKYDNIEPYLKKIGKITDTDKHIYMTTPNETDAVMAIKARHLRDASEYMKERTKIMAQRDGKRREPLGRLSETYRNYRGGNRMKTRRNKRSNKRK